MILVDKVAWTCIVFIFATTMIMRTWTVDEVGFKVIAPTVVVWSVSVAGLMVCALYRIWL